MTETSGWDDYWTGSSSGVAFGAEGATHPVLTAFWKKQFEQLGSKTSLLDVASGRGALLDHLDAAGCDIEQKIAVDFSQAALVSLRESHPTVIPVAGDVTAMPFSDGCFDMIVSQFGVEYGGSSAIDGLVPLLSSQGRLLLVLHGENSLIFEECKNNLSALEELQRLDFIPLAEAMFKAGYDVVRSQIGRKEAAGAARRLLEPFHALAGIMDRYGEDVAGGTIQTLYKETARIQGRFQYHMEDEVLQWYRTLSVEVEKYQGRMRSMLQSALSKADVESHRERWQHQGLSIDQVEQILDDNGKALGWAMSAVRSD